MTNSFRSLLIAAILSFMNGADDLPGGNPAKAADGDATPLADQVAVLKMASEAQVKALSGELSAARKAGAKGGSIEIKTILGNSNRKWQVIAGKITALVRSHPADPAALDGILLLGADFNDDLVEIIREHFMNDPRLNLNQASPQAC